MDMSEKRMLIVDDELLSKIDENRGEMSRSEFIGFIINTQLGTNMWTEKSFRSSLRE
jgi:metal-responsive CopG/Arc/MetJ family transcriptional regulator